MTTLLLIIQVIIVAFLIGIVLLQKTGADSLAGLSGGGHNLFSGKARGNILSKATIILAVCFILNSLMIAKLIQVQHKASTKLIESIVEEAPAQKKPIEVPQAAQ